MKNFIKKNEKIITYFLIILIIFLIILILYSFFLNYKQNAYLFDLKDNITIAKKNCDLQLKKNMLLEKNLNEFFKKEETPSKYTIFLLLSVVTFVAGFTVAGILKYRHFSLDDFFNNKNSFDNNMEILFDYIKNWFL
jgi:uncharacterized membrane protein YwzB